MNIKNILLLSFIFIMFDIKLGYTKTDKTKQDINCYVTIYYKWKKHKSMNIITKGSHEIFTFSGRYFYQLLKREKKEIIAASKHLSREHKFVLWYLVPCKQAKIWSNELIDFLKKELPKENIPDILKILHITTSNKEYKELWKFK